MILILLDTTYQIHVDYIAFEKLKRKRCMYLRETHTHTTELTTGHEINTGDKSVK